MILYEFNEDLTEYRKAKVVCYDKDGNAFAEFNNDEWEDVEDPSLESETVDYIKTY